MARGAGRDTQGNVALSLAIVNCFRVSGRKATRQGGVSFL